MDSKNISDFEEDSVNSEEEARIKQEQEEKEIREHQARMKQRQESGVQSSFRSSKGFK